MRIYLDEVNSSPHRMVDIEEAFAGRETVVLINPVHTSDSEKHADWRAQGKEDLWFKV